MVAPHRVVVGGSATTAVTWWLAHPEHNAQDMPRRCQRLLDALPTHPTQ